MIRPIRCLNLLPLFIISFIGIGAMLVCWERLEDWAARKFEEVAK